MDDQDRSTEIIYLMTGSNLGNRSKQLFTALTKITERLGTPFAVSSVYETEPWGFEHEVPFLNQAIAVETSKSPQELLELLVSIETEMGRTRDVPGYRARTMDIDILFYGQEIISSDNLLIPHPRLHERRFVLVPLDEIAPDFVHPEDNRTIHELLLACPDTRWVQKMQL